MTISCIFKVMDFFYCNGYPKIFDEINAKYNLVSSDCQVGYDGLANPGICKTPELCPYEPQSSTSRTKTPPISNMTQNYVLSQFKSNTVDSQDMNPMIIDCTLEFLQNNTEKIIESLITPFYSLTDAIYSPFRTHLGIQFLYAKVTEKQKAILFKSTKNLQDFQPVIKALDDFLEQSFIIQVILVIARLLATLLGGLWPAALPSIPHALTADLVLYLIEFLVWA